MPYTTAIDRTGAQALMPEDVAKDVLSNVPQQSACMRLARKLPNMNRAQRRQPVLASLLTAYFTGGDTNLKQTSKVDWSNKYIDAEELNVIVPIPKTVLDDADYDIWGEIRPAMEEAFGVAIDQAVLYGTNVPATWTTNIGGAGLVTVCSNAGQSLSLANYVDLYEALLGQSSTGTAGALMALEADGFAATGHIGHVSLRGQLRNCRDANGQPIFKNGANIGQGFATGDVDGAPILYPLNGAIDSTKSLDIMGAWNQLVYAMRTDLSYEVSSEAVIQGLDGSIVYNLWQQGMIALKATMRLGFALPNPINRMNPTAATRCPFSVLTS